MSHVTEKSVLWAKRSAVYTLSQRAVTTAALRKKIVERAVRKYEGIEDVEAEALADAAVDFCSANGFLNDALYSEYRVAEGVRKGHSKSKISMTLADKGIDRADAADAVGELDDLQAAINLARRKGYGPWRRVEPDQKRMAKEFSAFARLGFSSSIAWRVIKADESDLVDSQLE